MSDDKRIEAFLRQFRPRPPAPLPLPVRRPRGLHWLVGAAAAATVAFGVWRWAAGPEPVDPSPRRPEVLTLATASAAVRQGNHEDVLDASTAALLPDPSRPGRALRVLGDVTRDRRSLSPRRSR